MQTNIIIKLILTIFSLAYSFVLNICIANSDLSSINQSIDDLKINWQPKYDPTQPKDLLSEGSKFTNSNAIIREQHINGLNLSLIIITDQDKIATINHRNFREQDRIADFEIVKIEPYKVILQLLNNQGTEIQAEELNGKNDFIKKHLQNNFIVLQLSKSITNLGIINNE